jgi:steroid delta-isomerase-like uncharacterized protein
VDIDRATLLDDYLAAWALRDPVAIASFFTENGIYEDVPLGTRSVGRQQITEFVADAFVAIPDLRIDVQSIASDGDHVATEWVMSGTPVANLAAFRAGARFAVRGASIMQWSGECIRSNVDYYDLATVARQAGRSAAA